MNLLQLDNKKSRSDKIGRQTSDFKVNSLSKGGTDRQKIKLSVLIQMKKSKKAESWKPEYWEKIVFQKISGYRKRNKIKSIRKFIADS